MSFGVDASHRFLIELKQLRKRHGSILDDIEELGKSLNEVPRQATPIGSGCFKVRLTIHSKGKGKSGGARVITGVLAVRETVHLLSIYDKSEQERLSDVALKAILGDLGL